MIVANKLLRRIAQIFVLYESCRLLGREIVAVIKLSGFVVAKCWFWCLITSVLLWRYFKPIDISYISYICKLWRLEESQWMCKQQWTQKLMNIAGDLSGINCYAFLNISEIIEFFMIFPISAKFGRFFVNLSIFSHFQKTFLFMKLILFPNYRNCFEIFATYPKQVYWKCEFSCILAILVEILFVLIYSIHQNVRPIQCDFSYTTLHQTIQLLYA